MCYSFRKMISTLKNMENLTVYASPCGNLLIGEVDGAVCLCDWINAGRSEATLQRIQRRLGKSHISCQHGVKSPLLERTVSELEEYFAGKRNSFDIVLKPVGTEFQAMVWQSLLTVPYGHTATYMSIAEAIGRPLSVRAVANAIGANPLSILIPCHRIIGADGTLTGYAGGLEAKRYLLELENKYGSR